jgi:proteasome assembly chaperone (PAC2) family protein
MSHLTIHELPQLRRPVLITAFRGWPDAGEVASGAVRFLRRSLRTRKFAEIDPQPFYDFTKVRPTTRVVGPGQRAVSWPNCSFSFWQSDGERDLVLFMAPEPQLQWQTFIGAVFELAERTGVELLVSLGGTYDAVAHSRPTVVTGHATDALLRKTIQKLGINFSEYEGPASIQSAMLQGAHDRQLPAVSLFGHAPHYVTNVPNPKVSYGLLVKAAQLLGFQWDLSELQRAGVDFTIQVGLAMEEKPELKEYVRHLEGPEPHESPAEEPIERKPDEPRPAAPQELPAPDLLVRDLEDYLRELRQGEQSEG